MDQNNTGTVLKDSFDSRIKTVFSNTDNRKKLMKIIQTYADKNSAILLTNDMSQRLIFSDAEKKNLYLLTGITEAEITAALKETEIPPQWKKANNTFYVICLLLMHYFYSKGSKEDLACADALTVYLSYVLYTSFHKATFKVGVIKTCMDYTINSLSARFYIVQYGTIQACIEQIAIEAMHGRYDKEIKEFTDIQMAEIISALETRISSFIKSIGDEYFKNHKAGKYLNIEDEDITSEEDYHISDNQSFKIDKVTQLTLSEIMSKGFDEQNVLGTAMSLGGSSAVSKKKLISVMDSIRNERPDDVLDMIRSILVQFTAIGGYRIEDVGKQTFYSYEIYTYRSNAQDDMSYHIKDIIDGLMKYIDTKYGKNYIASGASSIANYKKIMFICFVMAIFNAVR